MTRSSPLLVFPESLPLFPSALYSGLHQPKAAFSPYRGLSQSWHLWISGQECTSCWLGRSENRPFCSQLASRDGEQVLVQGSLGSLSRGAGPEQGGGQLRGSPLGAGDAPFDLWKQPG